MVAVGVGLVLCRCAGKVVRTAEVFLGAHIDVVVVLVVEYGIQIFCHGDADGAWGQTFVFIGVVRTVGGEHAVENAADAEVLQGELHRGVRLQQHAFLQIRYQGKIQKYLQM